MNLLPYIRLPQDQYAHVGASAEWWWLVGTLTCGERQFGFEVDATGFMQNETQLGSLVSFLMVTDVLAARHYQQLTPFQMGQDWAQTDPAKPWYVQIGASGSPGSIAMNAVHGNPLNMRVDAVFTDAVADVKISISLQIEQSREPLLVWGDGRSPKPIDRSGRSAIEQYVYYYSLTDLTSVGTLRIGDNIYEVSGVTWMHHQYGAWPQSYTWALQDIQLDNGIRLSNITDPNVKLYENVKAPSHVTILWQDGRSTFYPSTVTPKSPSWTSPSGTIYFPNILVDVPELNASFTVMCLVTNQEIWNKELRDSQIYEGVAVAKGIFEGQKTSGPAWNEQHFISSSAASFGPIFV